MHVSLKCSVLLCAAVLLGFVDGSEVRAVEVDAAALLGDAAKLQNAGKFAEALPKWRQFLREFPKDAAVGQAQQGLGTCLLETGAFTEAVVAFDQALALLPKGESGWSLRWNRAVACQRRAEQSQSADDYKQAAAALQLALEDTALRADRRPMGHFYLARTEQALGQTESARKHYLKLLADKPDKTLAPAVLLALARMDEQDKHWPEAQGRYRDFLRDFPDHTSSDEARLGLADVLLKTGKLAEAEPLFGTLADRPASAATDYARFRWGEMAFLSGRYREASERLGPFRARPVTAGNRAAALLMLGETLSRTGQGAVARVTFERLLADYPKHPDRPRAVVGLAESLYEAGQPERAEESLQPALPELRKQEDKELLGRALVLSARCAARQGKGRAAVARYADCFKANVVVPEPDQTYLEAVAQAFITGDSEQGLEWLGALAKRAPEGAATAQARLYAARWHADKGQFEQALEQCRLVLAVKADAVRPQALFLSGFCAMKLRRFEDAVKVYQSLLDDHPRFDQAAAARFSLGLAHESLGAKTRAAAVYEQFLRLYPDDPLAARVKQRLEAVQPER